MKVSVILPTYNEVENIIHLVKAVESCISDQYDYEIIVIDDDSPDGTYRVASNVFKDNPNVQIVLRTQDKGFAKSIRHGLEVAKGDTVVVMDSDFTHDPREIPKLLHVGLVYDVVSGSRFCSGGQMVDLKHYLCSMAYNWLLRLLLHTQIQDNLGGFWTAKRTVILELPLNRIFYGYGDYFYRLLYYGSRKNLSIVELPSKYLSRNAGNSKSSWVKMIYRYSLGAAALRLSTLQMHHPSSTSDQMAGRFSESKN